MDRFGYRVFALILSCALLSSCDDQNFDWDAVHNQGNESLYESLFTSLFGGIDPDQNWDFSEGTTLESTRAVNSSYYPTISHNANDYYYVQQATLSWMKKNIPESGDKYSYRGSDGKQHPKQDNSFILYLPKTGFKITPIYQGQSGMTWDLYLVVNDGSDPIKIWSKSSEAGETNEAGEPINNYVGNEVEDFEIQQGSGCSVCSGSGSKNCTNCSGTGSLKASCDNNVFQISPSSSGSGWCLLNYNESSWYDSQDKSSKRGSWYTFIKIGNNYYLYNVSKRYYLTLQDSQLYYTESITESNKDASVAVYYNNRLTIGGRFITIDSNGNVGLATNWYDNNTTLYKFDETNSDDSQRTKITNALNNSNKLDPCSVCGGTGKITCTTCGGSGASSNGTWVTVSSLGDNIRYWYEDPKNTMTAAAVRSESLVWGSETESPLPAYKTAYFYLKVTGHQISDWKYETENAAKGKKQTSLDNQMIILTNCPRPTNVPSNHQVAIIGCEDSNLVSSDWDYNDIVFLMEGLPTIPIVSLAGSSTGSTSKTFSVNERSEKRYMVEDMGFGSIVDSNNNAKESTAVSNNMTDIDFNDIVVDFEQSRTVTHTITLSSSGNDAGTQTSDTKSVTADTTTATIRALGGTWDFQLAIGGDSNATPIFQKSLASGTNVYNVKNGSTTVQCPKVEFNPEYQLAEGKGIDALDARIMYNTGQATDKRGDGIYNYNTWIAKITHIGVDGAINKWDATANNVHFNLIDGNDSDLTSGSSANVKEGTSTTTSGGVTTYHVDFPSIGACPKIIAFPITKKWQRERIHVTKDWFNDSTNAVNSD